MTSYIPLHDYAKLLNIKSGDVVFVNSDSKIILFDAMRNKASRDLNDFINGLIEIVGPNGTVIFPTYNWGFCRGMTFDYYNTPSDTGSIGSLALKRDDFKRTKHPIYSMAVYGKYQEELVGLNNLDSFGKDSPFEFLREKNAINLIIDVSLQHCFTFVHYVEEQGKIRYRYLKDFTADYIDADGEKSRRTYSMFVRNLDLDVVNTIDPIESDFISNDVERQYKINNSVIRRIELGKAYDIIMNDIISNDSGKICTFKGQRSQL